MNAIDERSVSSASHWVDDMIAHLLRLYTRMSVAQPCCNGYNALVLALQASKLDHRHAVLIPTFTMIAVSNAVEQVGAKCIYVDNKAGSYNPSVTEYICSMELYMRNYRSDKSHRNHSISSSGTNSGRSSNSSSSSSSSSSGSNNVDSSQSHDDVVNYVNMIESNTTDDVPIIRAVIVCHTYGVPAEIEEIALFCKRHNLILIEDISECVGVSIKVKRASTMNDFIHNTHHDDDDDDSHSEIESSSPTMQLPLIDKMTTAIVNTLPSVDNQVHESVLLGSFGDFACASLYANKIIHGGDAGFVLARDIKMRYLLKSLVNHGFTGSYHFIHFVSAVNAKINGLGAALACACLSSIQTVLTHRNSLSTWYRKHLCTLVKDHHLDLMPHCGDSDTPWVFGVHVNDRNTRDLLREHLASFGIETRNYFFPNHLQPCFTHHFQSHCSLKNAEKLSSLGLYLPTFFYLEESDIVYICSHVISFFEA